MVKLYLNFLNLVRRSLQVYYHRQGNLKKIKESEEMIDTAFKKKPGGSKKIRYVELNENR